MTFTEGKTKSNIHKIALKALTIYEFEKIIKDDQKRNRATSSISNIEKFDRNQEDGTPSFTAQECASIDNDEYLEDYFKQASKYCEQSGYGTLPQWCKLVNASIKRYNWKSKRLNSKKKCTEFMEYMLEPFFNIYIGCISCHTKKIADDPSNEASIVKKLGEQFNKALVDIFKRSLIEKIEEHRANLPSFIKADLIGVDTFLNPYLHKFEDWWRYYLEEPVLLRLISITTLQKIRNDIEMIGRFEKDRKELIATYGISGFSDVKYIQTGMSDPHNGQKSVCIIYMSDGFKLVYKPRSLDCDIIYSKLISIIDEDRYLYNPKLINRRYYGWSEYIERVEPKTNEGIKKYYNRLGRIFALIEFIGGADFHEENFICKNDCPVPIDLEGIFSQVEIVDNNEETSRIPDEYKIHQLDATCILPRYQIINEDKLIIALGPLVFDSGTFFGESLSPTISNENNLNATLINTEEKRKSNLHLLSINENKVDPYTYLQDLLTGFQVAYARILKKKEILSDEIDRMCENDFYIRRLFRPTLDYAVIIRQMTEYSALKSNLSFMRCCRDRISSGISQVEEGDQLTLISAEMRQLVDFDIPVFNQNFSNGTYSDELIKFNHSSQISPLLQFKEVSLPKGEKYLQYALGYIRKSLNVYNDTRLKQVKWQEKSQISERKKVIKYTHELASLLLDSLMTNTDSYASRPLYTINLTSLSGSSGISMIANSPYFLEGVAGVILFAKTCLLSGIPVNQEWLKSISRQYKKSIQDLLERKLIDASGLYGISGAIYPLIFKYKQLQESDQFSRDLSTTDLLNAIELTHNLPLKSMERSSPDFLGGSCSNLILFSLLDNLDSYHSYAGFAEYELNHIVSTLTHNQNLGSFFDLKQNLEPTAGLAHGQSGVALALACYGKNYGYTTELINQIQIALNFERTLVNPVDNIWNNYSDSRGSLGVLGWCNGPAGIGLTRLFLLRELGSKYGILDDLKTSINCLKDREIKIDSFCCGNSSICLFLSKVSEYAEFNDEFLLDQYLNQKLVELLNRFIQDGVLDLNIGRTSFAASGLLGGMTGFVFSLLNVIHGSKKLDPFLIA